MRWALYVTLPPVWFDPGEVTGQLTPFWILYALHDALVKPMPGNMLSPSLAESWTVSADQLTYEFKLREGLKFHNGDAFTAEDVKFSFYRAKGSKVLRDKVKEVVAVDPARVRFVLHEPWPDFITFYGTILSGAGWIVPKAYVERVGDDGFKKAPVGLGPYKFVSYTPGIELVMEANEGYWRKTPSVKRIVFKTVPDSTTRLAMLKRGEVDIAYLLEGPQAQEIKRDPNLKLAFSGGIAIFYLDFLDQWDPKSPWHDRRVRLAANYAIDRQALSDAETLGASKPTGNHVPQTFEFALPIEPYPYDPAKAKQLLAEAGYPNGFDGGELHQLPPYFSLGEAIVGYMQAVGHPAQDADHGARRLHGLDPVEEGQGPLRLLDGALRQRGLAPVGGHPQRRLVGLRRLSRHRRALQAAGRGDRSQQARGDAAPDPAAGARARQVWPDLPVRLAQWRGPARRRAGVDADRPLPVVGAARRGAAQEELKAAPVAGAARARRAAGTGLRTPAALNTSLDASWSSSPYGR